HRAPAASSAVGRKSFHKSQTPNGKPKPAAVIGRHSMAKLSPQPAENASSPRPVRMNRRNVNRNKVSAAIVGGGDKRRLSKISTPGESAVSNPAISPTRLPANSRPAQNVKNAATAPASACPQ